MFWSDYKTRQMPNAPLNIIGMHGEAHASRRKLWGRGFVPESLQSYEEHIGKHASAIVEKLKEREGEDINIVTWINYFTYVPLSSVRFNV